MPGVPDRPLSDTLQNPGPGWSHFFPTPKTPVRGGLIFPLLFWYFLEIRSVTMTDSDEDGWEEGTRDEEQNSEGDDDVEEEESSGSRPSSKPILRLPKRNDEDTGWTHADGTKPFSDRNKLTVEDMTRVRKRKELMRTEVTKNELVDRWLRDHIKPERWDRITVVFPHGDKYSSHQKWVIMTEDTKSPVPYRYQQYGITVNLNPDKDDRLHSTFGTLHKTYPTLWIYCSHHNCMSVYDVTNSNDTQRNTNLTEHHTLDVKTHHGHKSLQSSQYTSGHIDGPKYRSGPV